MVSQTRRDIMGMPITVMLIDENASGSDISDIFAYFQTIDTRFSTYKKDSEISKLNRGEVKGNDVSKDMRTVLHLAEKAKRETQGYFDIQTPNRKLDPSGLVKGWAIWEAAKILQKKGFENFFIEAGGDIQTAGYNTKGEKWRVGLKNPFSTKDIVKVVHLSGEGIATSGTYLRGAHIYNPYSNEKLDDVVSMTVIGPNVYRADCFATAAFAMQRNGIVFLERQEDLEGYMIDKNGIATMTRGFEKYV